jgi:hypothetical protein
MIKTIGLKLSLIGIIVFLCGVFFHVIEWRHELIGTVAKLPVTEINQDFFEFSCVAKIKNTNTDTIRICGGQLNWCNQTGCYRITTPLPIILQPQEETFITVAITPQGNNISKTEFTLYADGKELKGLTPIVIKLPAMFR